MILNDILKQLKTAVLLLLLLTTLTGLVYPLLVTAFANLLFPWQAQGSILQDQGQPIGSLLIGQTFARQDYFWGRPSATTPSPYNGQSSAGSNSGPSNPNYLNTVKSRVQTLQAANPDNFHLIPADLVTASGSGLDPEISPLAAYYQVPRIAKARHIPKTQLNALIKRFIQPRTLGFLGEPRVNVLQLNIALNMPSNRGTYP